MGLLDDAIREHLELKRKHGADPGEVERQEREVLGAREQAEFAPAPEAASPEADEPVAEAADPVDAGEEREPFADEVDEPLEAALAAEDAAEPGGAEPFDVEALESRAPAPEPAPPPPSPEPDPWLEEARDEVPAEESLAHPDEPGEEPAEDVLEDTPDFLQETPEHDRLWFEQRPPRDFDWDK